MDNPSARAPVSLLFRWVPPLLLYSVIFWVSSLPPSRLPSGIPDVIPHFLEYLAMGFLTARAVRPRNRRDRILLFLALLALALGDEFHQFFVPRRTCSLHDFLTDGVGVLAGIILWGRITKVLKLFGNTGK